MLNAVRRLGQEDLWLLTRGAAFNDYILNLKAITVAADPDLLLLIPRNPPLGTQQPTSAGIITRPAPISPQIVTAKSRR